MRGSRFSESKIVMRRSPLMLAPFLVVIEDRIDARPHPLDLGAAGAGEATGGPRSTGSGTARRRRPSAARPRTSSSRPRARP